MSPGGAQQAADRGTASAQAAAQHAVHGEGQIAAGVAVWHREHIDAIEQLADSAARFGGDAERLAEAERRGLHRMRHPGLAVHLAARIMALAEGGEVFVSRTVRDLVVGSELSFTDRGEHQLKGIEEPWQLYSLS